MVFLDTSKAFDTVWVYYNNFVPKDIESNFLECFQSYLTRRKQMVILDNVKSNSRSTNAAVPQGSVFGPLLFLLCINDIADNTNKHVTFIS